MDEKIKANVKIYGQDYVLSGDSTREHMLKVANYVDAKMQEVSVDLSSGPFSSLAVLSAVNIADEFFKTREAIEDYRRENQRLTKDTQHYVQLWDEAKNSFLQYKEDANIGVEQTHKNQLLLEESEKKVRELTLENSRLLEKYNAAVQKNEDLINRMKAQEDSKESTSTEMRELTEKCREMENGFFDLQMENIQLKGELDRCKKMMD
jgi:cell division protein ZapA